MQASSQLANTQDSASVRCRCTTPPARRVGHVNIFPSAAAKTSRGNAGVARSACRRAKSLASSCTRGRNYLRQLVDDAFCFERSLELASFQPMLATELSRSSVAAYVDALGVAEADRGTRTSSAWRYHYLIRLANEWSSQSKWWTSSFEKAHAAVVTACARAS